MSTDKLPQLILTWFTSPDGAAAQLAVYLEANGVGFVSPPPQPSPTQHGFVLVQDGSIESFMW